MSEKSREKGVFTLNLSLISGGIFAKIGRTEPQKVAPKQFKELSVNSGTKVTQSGTWDARRQFRDCPGHSGTVGSPNNIEYTKTYKNTHNH